MPGDVLAEGLIDVSLLSRIENGERPLYKTMRNRLLGRLGVTPDMYENLLDNEDYITWKWHHHILYAIEQKDFQKAVQLIRDYEKQQPLDDKTKQQFCVMMCGEVLRLQGIDNAKLASLYEKAVHLTVPQVEQIYKEGVPEKLLSVLEVNTILEYEYYRKSKEKTFIKKCRYWINYVEESFLTSCQRLRFIQRLYGIICGKCYL